MRRSLFPFLAVLLLPLFLLTGCWEEDPEPEQALIPIQTEEEEEEEQVILPSSFSLPYDPSSTLDPILCDDGMQQVVGSLLYQGLFQLDTQLEPQPVLCADYTVSEDATVYTFTLKSSVLFSDGSALTAQDVAATLQRARTSPRYQARLADIVSVTAGDGAVTLTLSHANTGLPALLDIPVVKAGTEQSLLPIGTGPYCVEQREDGTVLTANPYCADQALPVPEISLSPAVDRDAMLYQFSSHDVQLITGDQTGTEPIVATGNVSYQDADTTILQYIGFNVLRTPLDNAQLRAALGLGIRRSALVSAYLSGHAKAAQFPVSPASPLYPEHLEQVYSYDAFASAMTAAGYGEDGAQRTVTLLVNSENAFKLSAAQDIATSLSEFSLNVEVRSLPWEEYIAALAAGDFDLYYGEVRLTADWDLTALLGTGGALNYGGWADPQTDLLLSQYAAAQDRASAMEALCSYLRDQSPILPVCFKSTSVLYQTGVVEGLTPTMANPFYDLSGCSIHLLDA